MSKFGVTAFHFNLKMHIKGHNFPYFIINNMLGSHISSALEQTCSKELPFKCQYCDKSFKRKYSVERQIKVVHLGQRPFDCQCGKKFATKEQLDRHIITKHTSERPFPCEKGCDKFFSSHNARAYHYKMHHENLKFKCEFVGCNREFTSLRHLRRHLEKPHDSSLHQLTHKLAKKKSKIDNLKKEINELRQQNQALNQMIESRTQASEFDVLKFEIDNQDDFDFFVSV